MTGDLVPKVIFLDWAGTMSESAFWSHWRDEAPGDWEVVQTRLFGDRELVDEWMRGRLTAEDVVARLEAGTAFDTCRCLRELEKSCREMQLTDESLWEVVPRIRANGIRVVIATDNMDTFRRWTVPALGLTDLVDEILDSWTLGVCKRDVNADAQSAFFQPWLQANGVAPSETILFDDLNQHVGSFGIRWVEITGANPLVKALQEIRSLERGD